jgi:hypothetical protein
MADWFVEVAVDTGLSEVFEFIDYRKAVEFGASRVEDSDALAVELVDCDGRVLMVFGQPFDGTTGWSSTPRRAGLYRWDDRSEQMRRVQP